jgi:hypothetical protein
VTIKANPVQHDAQPNDGHTYRLRLVDDSELLAHARWSYSGTNVVFCVLDDDGRPTGWTVNELSDTLVDVERVTTTPAPGLAATPTNLARPEAA